MSSYAQLKSDIDEWLARSDIAGSATVADTLIDVTEARINRRLRCYGNEMMFSATVNSDGAFQIPSDYAELKEAFCYSKVDAGSSTEDFPTVEAPVIDFSNVSVLYRLERTTADRIYLQYESFSASGDEGKFIARSGGIFIVRPTPTAGVYLGGIYYAKFPALSVSQTTNWLTTNAYDLLLYGCLREAAAYIKSRDQEAYWAGRFEESLAELNGQNEKEGTSGSPLTQRIE